MDKTLFKRLKKDGLSWPEDKDLARKVQRELADKVALSPLAKAPALIAGVDSAFFDDRVISTACLFSFPSLELIEETFAIKEVRFPYIPGLLSFREGTSTIEAIEKLKKKPDLIIFDGQGIAHPRGLGIASYAGVLLDIPSVGCAKSRLVGEYDEPGKTKGSWSPLKILDKTVGAVLRTRANVEPVFVSPGHKIDIKGSLRLVLACATAYRLPEPTRRADALSKTLARKHASRA
ncbi:MAG: deoxyribonuclease V [Deltaproteobacteria bacterium]|nr:deoxyribonuclease V [Deltaproteobacteria bacterium]